MHDLSEHEYNTLRETVGELPKSPWGAVKSQCLEVLYKRGYVDSLGRITGAGALYLDQRKLEDMGAYEEASTHSS